MTSCVLCMMNVSLEYAYMISTKSTHLPVEGHLGCFQFGAIMNKATLNINKPL